MFMRATAANSGPSEHDWMPENSCSCNARMSNQRYHVANRWRVLITLQTFVTSTHPSAHCREAWIFVSSVQDGNIISNIVGNAIVIILTPSTLISKANSLKLLTAKATSYM